MRTKTRTLARSQGRVVILGKKVTRSKRNVILILLIGSGWAGKKKKKKKSK
jgi:hypothetical protein